MNSKKKILALYLINNSAPSITYLESFFQVFTPSLEHIFSVTTLRVQHVKAKRIPPYLYTLNYRTLY